MKNKLLSICAIILFSLTSACSCSNKKSVELIKFKENINNPKDIYEIIKEA